MIKSEKNDPRMVSLDDFDHLVYLRIFEGCNLHCEHCFIPANPKKMTIEQIKEVPNQLAKFAKPGSRILLQWHGGEPTSIGNRMFKEALELLENSEHKFKWTHGIQTNLINYNENWRDLYHKYFDSSIGVSWDPIIRLMKKDDPESNNDYEEKFWQQIEQLIRDGIEPYMVITGTKLFFEKYKDPFELFEFLESKGITKVHIERLTNTGYARENWERIGLDNLEYSNYMSRIAKAYHIYQNKERKEKQPLNISPFDGLYESVDRLLDGEAGGYGCLSGACDSRFHTIDATGYKKGCTALTSEYDNKSIKNTGEAVIRIVDFKMARKLRQVDCYNCEYKTICSSGCLATDKVDESGECSGAKGLFNTIYKIKTS